MTTALQGLKISNEINNKSENPNRSSEISKFRIVFRGKKRSNGNTTKESDIFKEMFS